MAGAGAPPGGDQDPIDELCTRIALLANDELCRVAREKARGSPQTGGKRFSPST